MRRISFGTLAVFGLVVIGIASAAYVLVQQRLNLPLRDTYHVKVEFTAADGVVPGLGQPVQVAGVKVGTISAARLAGGNAEVTIEIERAQLPRLHADARATLEPVTPLKDMRVALDPGRPPAPEVGDGATIGVQNTLTPTGLDEVLSGLDTDTRDFLASLLAGLDEGTADRAAGLRATLRSLGPTTAQLHRVTAALDRRRHNLTRLVSNLASLTEAAGQDRELSSLIASSQQTLHAVAVNQAPLRQAVRALPRTLHAVRSTLDATTPLAAALPGTLDALDPAVRRLPATLDALGPFADRTTTALRDDLRPLVRDAQPLMADLGPGLDRLAGAAPSLTSTLTVFHYLTNELAFNPAGDDEGLLFWLPWWFHNYVSMFSAQDAHGSAARAMVMVNCQQFTELAALGDVLKVATGAYSICGGDG
jgi:phospholipid/cholesterol/gamma-HCH transport system substrate-binding protein